MRNSFLPPLLLLALLGCVPSCSHAADLEKDAVLQVSNVWARESLPPHQNSAAFMVIENHGSRSLQLRGVSTPRAEVAELHRMEMKEGTMRMRRVEAFSIPAGAQFALEPGHQHLMFFSLPSPWKAGQVIPLHLEFSNGFTVDVQATVRPL